MLKYWPQIRKSTFFKLGVVTAISYVLYLMAGFLLPLLLGIDGIWLAVTAAELAALAVSAAMLLTKDKVFHYRKA